MTIVETELKSRGIVLAEERTDLAVQRTVIAAERTLMAWIRTAISMIGFGFSIYKFFQYQAEGTARGASGTRRRPRNLGMTLVALGTLALSAAAWQHRNLLKEIGASQTRHVLSISSVVGLAVILIGSSRFTVLCCDAGRFSRDATFASNLVANRGALRGSASRCLF